MKTTRTNTALESAASLAAYQLPDGILPLAPRGPFARFSPEALARAIDLAADFPEKRGMMSRAARRLGLAPPHLEPDPWVTMEAHFDAANVLQPMANALVAIGFELDGFARFNPNHFSDHFTLKFKLDARDKARRAQIFDYIHARCAEAQDVSAKFPEVEAYLETEVYSEANRRSWTPGHMTAGWQEQFPLSSGELVTLPLPCTEREAENGGLDLKTAKRADIHVKIARGEISQTDRDGLMGRLRLAGFYPVLTWAGNDIFTAQFLKARDATEVFRRLAVFFEAFGGSAEMTLEPCVAMWRSISTPYGRLAAVPPLIVRVASSLNTYVPPLPNRIASAH